MLTESRLPNSRNADATSMFESPGAIPTSHKIVLDTSSNVSGVVSLKDKSTILCPESFSKEVILLPREPGSIFTMICA